MQSFFDLFQYGHVILWNKWKFNLLLLSFFLTCLCSQLCLRVHWMCQWGSLNSLWPCLCAFWWKVDLFWQIEEKKSKEIKRRKKSDNHAKIQHWIWFDSFDAPIHFWFWFGFDFFLLILLVLRLLNISAHWTCNAVSVGTRVSWSISSKAGISWAVCCIAWEPL